MPADPHAPVPPSSRLSKRTQDAIRLTENLDRSRYNGSAPPDWRDQRGDRHVWRVKVTASATSPNLYPAKLRYWTGYDGTTHSFADLPGAAAVWVYPVAGGLELATDGEYIAVLQGIHTDGKAVLEAVTVGDGSGSGSGEDTVDLWVQISTCPTVEVDGSGSTLTGITVMRQLLRLPASFVVGDPACEANPTDCCATPWTDACCDGAEVHIPDLWANFTAKTGEATCLPNSIHLTELSGIPGTGGLVHTNSTDCTDGAAANLFVNVTVVWTCNDDGTYRVTAGFHTGHPVGGWIGTGVTPADGWTVGLVSDFGATAYKDVPCDEPDALADPETVGTWALSDGLGHTAGFTLILST